MKQFRFLTMSFLVLALGLVISIGPSSAAIYKDNFTATIIDIENSPHGAFNPYGLSGPDPGPATTFNWYIVYDTSTIQNISGYLPLSGYSSINQINIAIPTPGGGLQIFTKEMEDPLSYGNGYYNDPSGYIKPAVDGKLSSLSYWAEALLVSPHDGNITVDFIFPGFPSLQFGPNDTSNRYSVFYLDLGLSSFNPLTDRQVVPIPGALVLLGSGLAALTILRRRQE
jgi:hypothetical protein